MIHQPRRSDKYHVYRYQKSIIVLLNDTLMLKEGRFGHKNTPSNQNIRFKVNVIRIPLLYFWVLDSYLPLVQDCVVILLFDQKGQCMVFTNQESRFFQSFNKV